MKHYTFLFEDGKEFHVIGYNWNDAFGRFQTVSHVLGQTAETIVHIQEKQ